MESRVEELEVDLRIANARAEIAIALVRELTKQLALSGVITWNDDDLVREFGKGFDVEDAARDFAMLDVPVAGDPEEMIGEAYSRDMQMRRRLRAEILAQVRHDRNPS